MNANLVLKWLLGPRFRLSGKDAASFLPVEVVRAYSKQSVDKGAVLPDGHIEIALLNSRLLKLSGAYDPDLVRGLSS